MQLILSPELRKKHLESKLTEFDDACWLAYNDKARQIENEIEIFLLKTFMISSI